MEEQPDKVAIEPEGAILPVASTREQRQVSQLTEQTGVSQTKLTSSDPSTSNDPAATSASEAVSSASASEPIEGGHHEKDGQPGHTKKSTGEYLTDLNASYTDLRTQLPTLTPEFFHSSDPEAIHTRSSN